MEYQVVRLLQPDEVAQVVSGLSQRTFVDGKATAAGRAREVKYNLQLPRSSAEHTDLDQIILSAFQRNLDLQGFCFPKQVVLPIFSRYDSGMKYGTHVDNALMHGIRSDFATTLFLTAPDTYDGGELVIEMPLGQEEIKLDAGEAIVYPASTLHHVAAVTRGVRLAAVTWIQSLVRDERLRTILKDLMQCSKQKAVAEDMKLSLLLTKSYHNLLRYAAEP